MSIVRAIDGKKYKHKVLLIQPPSIISLLSKRVLLRPDQSTFLAGMGFTTAPLSPGRPARQGQNWIFTMVSTVRDLTQPFKRLLFGEVVRLELRRSHTKGLKVVKRNITGYLKRLYIEPLPSYGSLDSLTLEDIGL